MRALITYRGKDNITKQKTSNQLLHWKQWIVFIQ